MTRSLGMPCSLKPLDRTRGDVAASTDARAASEGEAWIVVCAWYKFCKPMLLLMRLLKRGTSRNLCIFGLSSLFIAQAKWAEKTRLLEAKSTESHSLRKNCTARFPGRKTCCKTSIPRCCNMVPADRRLDRGAGTALAFK